MNYQIIFNFKAMLCLLRVLKPNCLFNICQGGDHIFTQVTSFNYKNYTILEYEIKLSNLSYNCVIFF